MDIAYQLALYLQTNGYGTVGTDIFVGALPTETNGIYIDRLGGSNDYYTAISRASLNVFVRDTNASDASQTIANIKNFLHRMVGTETVGASIYSILSLGEVENLGRDLESSNIYKVTVQMIYRDKNLIS